jgi:predicted pyridoxine 5'-phosphate oxidase superfamily flavin-nucleotide-binding protein
MSRIALAISEMDQARRSTVAYDFLDILSTPAVRAAQAANGSAEHWSGFHGNRTIDRLTKAEALFIAERDSFYMATASQTSWPYVQHRGGPPGFLRVLDEKTLGFADFRGNRQYISVGNLAADDRAALILMDYPGRRRLKILAHLEPKDLAGDPDLTGKLATPGYKAKAERAMLLHLEAVDWNCPQHITPRFTEAELAEALSPVRRRMAELEAENKVLRERLERAPSVVALLE